MEFTTQMILGAAVTLVVLSLVYWLGNQLGKMDGKQRLRHVENNLRDQITNLEEECDIIRRSEYSRGLQHGVLLGGFHPIAAGLTVKRVVEAFHSAGITSSWLLSELKAGRIEHADRHRAWQLWNALNLAEAEVNLSGKDNCCCCNGRCA